MDRTRLCTALVALALCGAASAQQTTAAPAPAAGQPAMDQLTPEQREALARQDADMARAALQVMQLVDADRIGEVWDGASAAMKQAVTREDFIRQVGADRGRLGPVASRGDAQVSRSLFQAAMRPALMSTTVTRRSGHLAAIMAMVGPPTYPAPIQRIFLFIA